MTCAKKIVENNLSRQCWLPIHPNSPFSLCSRCDYQEIQELLSTPQNLAAYINNPKCIQLLKQKEHEVSLLNALTKLQLADSSLFNSLYSAVQTPKLESTLKFLICTHTPSQRCNLYKYAFAKMYSLNHILRYSELPWKCWPCMASLLRTKSHNWYRAFSNGLIRNRLHAPELNREYVLDCMVSLYLIHKDHAVRLLFEQYRRVVKTEEAAISLLQDFLSQPCSIGGLFTKTSLDYIPITWQKDDYIKRFQTIALKNVKARNYVFKEDLMIKTWAPHRLFPWCLDLDELKDFD